MVGYVCSKCADTGMHEERTDYPWGGYDILLVFCECSKGIAEEKEYNESFANNRVD